MMPEHRSFRLAVNERIYLSDIRPTDKAAFVEFLNCREIYEQTLRIPFPYTEADADSFLRSVDDTNAKLGHPVNFAIRNEDDKLIGGIGFDGPTFQHRAEIGYWLAKPFWNRGIMTEVVGAACQFARVEWKLVRITAHVFEFNVASARVLEKNGFCLEGHLRKHHQKDGQFLDSKLYALVK